MIATPPAMSMVRRRRERSTTTSVSEPSKEDVSRFISTSLATPHESDSGSAELYYPNKSVAATDPV
jgi:hypothetical protein